MGQQATPPAGATPAAAGATPVQTAPAPPPAAAPTTTPATTPPAPPATDGSEALGDAGKRALDAMKAERNAAIEAKKASDAELERIKAEHLTEGEKALVEAKKAGATEAAAKLTNRIRTTEAKSALIAAGADPALVDLAVKADQFQALKVTDDGEVQGLEEAVKAFKAATPSVFAKAPAAKPGSADQGARGGQPTERSATLQDALAKRFAG